MGRRRRGLLDDLNPLSMNVNQTGCFDKMALQTVVGVGLLVLAFLAARGG